MAVLVENEFIGNNAASVSLEMTINELYKKFIFTDTSKGVLIQFTIHEDYPSAELAGALEIIWEGFADNLDLIIGTKSDNRLPKNYVKSTVLFASSVNCIKKVSS